MLHRRTASEHKNTNPACLDGAWWGYNFSLDTAHLTLKVLSCFHTRELVDYTWPVCVCLESFKQNIQTHTRSECKDELKHS